MAYDRARDLPKLIPIQLGEYPSGLNGQARLVRDLVAGLEAENRRQWSRHFAYDAGRHQRLHAAYRIELARLLELCGAAPITPPNPTQAPVPAGADHAA